MAAGDLDLAGLDNEPPVCSFLAPLSPVLGDKVLLDKCGDRPGRIWSWGVTETMSARRSELLPGNRALVWVPELRYYGMLLYMNLL